MRIQSKSKEYSVIMEEELTFLAELQKDCNTQFVIDKKVYELYQDYFSDIPSEKLILLDAIEENKTIDTALAICEKMTVIPAKRNARMVSVGGGIIQDITGFAANILYRGISWIFVPTTLLAACDSCIGGKTSLNYKKYKNLLGTFYPPDEIHICAKFFQTLSEQDFKSGMGEVTKFNLMAGKDGIVKLQNNMPQLLQRDEETILRFVKSSLEFKKAYIEEDEFDRGVRIQLNFAHTFGHAIEVLTGYKIPHGTAVAIGMIMADCISVQRGILSKAYAEESEKLLLQVIDIGDSLLHISTESMIEVMRKDKKQTDNSLTAILMADCEDGRVELKIMKDLQKDEVEYALQYVQKL